MWIVSGICFIIKYSTLLTVFLEFIEGLDKGFKRWVNAIGFVSLCTAWVTRIFRSKDEHLYTVKFNSDKIQTLLTGNSSRVTEWCRSLTKDFLDEPGRPGVITVFEPPFPNFSKVSYLVLFLAPDRCLIFRLNYGTLVPIHVRRDIFQCPNLVFFFFDAKMKLRNLMKSHTPASWKLPGNFINLPIVLNASPSDLMQGFAPIKAASSIMDDHTFKYVPPKWILVSNWEKRSLSQDQVQFLVMRAYSALLVARKTRLTRWPLQTINFSDDEDSVKSSDSPRYQGFRHSI